MRAGLSSAPPRKAARKAPVRTKTSSKKVTAPVRHKPKGSPKERLAYLNKGEMAALEKRKGSPARRGPKGLPSFADDSASSKGVSRGDSFGTKGSGSTKTSSGSVSKGGSYNSGTSGSKGGGASTQSPGMGRNEGRVGPSSPMGGQGASFATPKAARDDTLRRAYGIEDQRGRMGPFKGELPSGMSLDVDDRKFNPNKPEKRSDRMAAWERKKAKDDEFARTMASRASGQMRNPQEIRSRADLIRDDMRSGGAFVDALRVATERGEPGFNAASARRSISTPNISVGLGGVAGGKTNFGGNYRSGGAVKSLKKK